MACAAIGATRDRETFALTATTDVTREMKLTRETGAITESAAADVTVATAVIVAIAVTSTNTSTAATGSRSVVCGWSGCSL